jgi:hypothetical protein
MLEADVIHGNSNASPEPQIGYRLVRPDNNNEIWHYGITDEFRLFPSCQVQQTRYTQAFLDRMGLRFEPMTGTMPNRLAGRAWEEATISGYMQLNGGEPPPGNRAGTRY